jgi:hypothetical protein
MVTRKLVAAVLAGAVLVSGPRGTPLLAAGQGQAFQAAAPALAAKVNVTYQRAYVSEIMTNDLNVRVGLRHAFAEPVARCATFTFEGKDVAVKEVLEHLARDCGLVVEYRGQTAIFWKKADDQALAALARKLKAWWATRNRTSPGCGASAAAGARGRYATPMASGRSPRR